MAKIDDPSAPPQDPTVEGEDPDKLSKQEFEDQQAALARSQNLREGTVPEQRPQAFAVPDPSAMHSELHKKLADADALPDNEPMGYEAYARAQSKEQAKKAEKASKRERLYPGTRVTLTKEPHDGRNAVIMEVNFASDEDRRNAASGVPALSNFAEVESYIVKTRDSRTDVLTVDPEDLVVKSVRQGWGRGE